MIKINFNLANKKYVWLSSIQILTIFDPRMRCKYGWAKNENNNNKLEQPYQGPDTGQGIKNRQLQLAGYLAEEIRITDNDCLIWISCRWKEIRTFAFSKMRRREINWIEKCQECVGENQRWINNGGVKFVSRYTVFEAPYIRRRKRDDLKLSLPSTVSIKTAGTEHILVQSVRSFKSRLLFSRHVT